MISKDISNIIMAEIKGPYRGRFDLGGKRSENEMCGELTCEVAYKIC